MNSFKLNLRRRMPGALQGRSLLLLAMGYICAAHANAAPAGALPWESL